MKREICCLDCGYKWREIGRSPSVVEDGEKVSVITGLSLRSLMCDGCGKEIHPQDQCCAVSVLARGQRSIPGWEYEYVS
jgi:hypothetical protein